MSEQPSLPAARDFREIPVTQLHIHPEQQRQVPAGATADAQLEASIRAIGLLQPIVVRWWPSREPGEESCYLVLAGRRRLAACRAIGLETVPCLVRAPQDEAGEGLVELSENIVRAQLSPVDVWAAVEQMVAVGMTIPGVAVALNIAERRVKQLVAMGGLHPAIVAHMRAQQDFPAQHDLEVICQASLTLQGEAFAACKPTAGHGVAWWKVASGCRITRIPLAHARFDRALYKGPVYADLFAEEEGTEEASSPALFLKLQEAWLETELARYRTLGFQAEKGEAGNYSAIERPSGCSHHYEPVNPKKLPAKKLRAKLRYVAAIGADGEVTERFYTLAEPKPGAAAGGGEATTPGAAAPKVLPAVTAKGLAAIELAKREAVAGSVAGCLGAADLLAVALLALAQRTGIGREAAAQALLNPAGALELDDDNRDLAVRALAQQLLPKIIATTGASALLPLHLVERIGVGFASVPRLTLDRDGLDQLKGPGLEAVRTARRMPSFNTQKELKAHMLRTSKDAQSGQIVLTPADLAALALVATPKVEAMAYDDDEDDDLPDDPAGEGGEAGEEKDDAGEDLEDAA